MSFKTHQDLEIVYNLRWKNLPKREDKKQLMSIVAVYDIPATTLNFKVFKSYLLKNSTGSAQGDVNVYYVTESGKEYPIHSQTDFQVALYAFRRKARKGEIINLLLEKIPDPSTEKMPKKPSIDVETQFDLQPSTSKIETAPDWFVAGLAQLKKELKEEISANVSTQIAQAVAELKSVCPYRIKSKHEKRSKKIVSHGITNAFDTKTLLKSLKYDTKLDKLERQATKCREKRLALQQQHREGEAGCSNARKLSVIKAKEKKRQIEEDDDKSDEETNMDGKPLNVQAAIPHMIGGEHYIHEWLVENTGQDQWTSLTTLQYTWGSKSLVALKKSIPVPFLKPGEKGVVSAALYIPEEPGQYECYWQLMHKGRRFGHWLGAQFIVDPIADKNQDDTVQFKTQEARNSAEALKPYYESMGEEILKTASDNLAAFLSTTEDEDQVKHEFTSTPDDSDCSWTSETQRRLLSKVPIPDCFNLPEKEVPKKAADNFDDNNNSESLNSGTTIKLTDDELDNMVLITLPKDEYAKGGFINVHVDGQKVAIPMNLLNSELKDAAQRLADSKSPSPPKNDPPMESKALEEPIVPVQIMDNNVAVDLSTPPKNLPESEENVEHYFEANNYMSHCSAAGSCFSEVNAPVDQQKRLFVFPQDNPGYEMVYPVLDLKNPEQPTLISGNVPQQPAAANPFIVEAVPNFQQTPPEERRHVVLAINPAMELAMDLAESARAAPEPIRAATPPQHEPSAPAAQVHILPETLVSGAVSAASSAINTARSVINMIKPQSPGRWVNGHWVSANPETPREANLQALAEMGFWNRDLNATLLARFNDDLNRVVAELVQ